MTARFERHITAETDGVTAIELLAEHTCLSKQQLKNAMINGSVWLESKYGINRIRRGKKPLRVGDRLYGAEDSEADLQLRSVYLAFNCPATGTWREYSL